jgi:hypothetical protein
MMIKTAKSFKIIRRYMSLYPSAKMILMFKSAIRQPVLLVNHYLLERKHDVLLQNPAAVELPGGTFGRTGSEPSNHE